MTGQTVRKGRPVVLIGFMATGKTTVGRLVAERLDRKFLDLDQLVEETAGTTVAELFRTAGEPAFRRAEAQALRKALATRETVLATGGGAACRQDNLEAMLAEGLVVALSATPLEVLRRTGGPSGRPLLDGAEDPLTVATRLLGEREPFYARAHLRVDTVGKTPEEVAALVADAVLQHEET
jgi:shikimate kinase